MAESADPSGSLMHGEGLHVRMARINGVTLKGVLVSPFIFQCPPLETFRRDYGFGWTDYQTVGGPRSRPAQRQLMAIQFQTLFLDGGYPWTLNDPMPLNNPPHGSGGDNWYQGPSYEKRVHNIHDSYDILSRQKILLRIMNSGTPFHLTVGNTLFLPDGVHEVDMDATLRACSVEERHGEPDTRYIDVQFVEFPGLPKQKVSKLPVKLLIRTLPKSKNTMHKLAIAYYHEASKWRLIAKKNPWLKGVGANVNLVQKFGKSKKHLFIVVPKES